ncbi:Hsp20/alpha crystallin family protein [Pseudomonas sp. AOB-7]|jgi:HSP20 family protein|uniref:Hsp20/alpha crystallin family protein n=1 Tax=Pseudomonas sp. AOB-7 TaxID=2482750 RepID=UPI000EFBD164|nr:Hsp20/alpha crystallin family protein [Pseudomonas sp. AOB-7]RMH85890.1 Hsp20/alpha crystallin family protein [Pseudomonas sp. AOB-7]
MAHPVKEVPEKAAPQTTRSPALSDPWRPLDTLRTEVDRLFEDFIRPPLNFPFGRSSFDIEPFWKRSMSGYGIPAVDIAEKDKSFEITVELPGMEEKDIQIRLANGNLSISGEKKDEKEETRKDYHLSERHYGSFERIFSLPKGVDVDHIEANFSKGVLAISLPKRPEAVKPEKVIPVKSR